MHSGDGRQRDTLAAVLTLIAGVILPLAGAVMAGTGDWQQYLRFPPQPPRQSPTVFSWIAFWAIAAGEVLVLTPFLWRLLGQRGRRTGRRPGSRWPWWGTAGLVLLGLSWALAWQRAEALAALRPHAFTPLWVGYIVAVNALIQRRTGASPLTASPGRFLWLFPASAGFWWLFEYLNQFVGNWYYLGTVTQDPWTYLVSATLPFSTVLPAVTSTYCLLASFPRLHAPLASAWPLPGSSTLWACAAAALGAAGLVGIGAAPGWTFPMLWLAPGLLLIGLQERRGAPHPLRGLCRGGDWRAAWLAALAGLLCGFFWEMWNVNALARWEYRVPLVQGFTLFRMPVLGYGGYLPFGIECLACVHALLGARWLHRWSPGASSPASDVRDNAQPSV